MLRASTLDEAIALAEPFDSEPFVIGGAQLFRLAIDRVFRIYLTEIPGEPDADVFFTFDRAPFRTTREWEAAGLRFLVLERRRPT